MIERSFRLARYSVMLAHHARTLAEQGNTKRAMRALALSDAFHRAAGGDEIGKKLALKEAMSMRRAERREKDV